MYANQILKYLSVGREEWQSEAYIMQKQSITHLIKRCHHFYFGRYGDFENDLVKMLEGKKLFMGNLANNLKIPYDNFLLCFQTGPSNTNSGHSKYALFVQRYNTEDVGITIEFLISDGSKWWTLLPFSRLYMFNQTLEQVRPHLGDLETSIKTDNNAQHYTTNTGIMPFINDDHIEEFINIKGKTINIQKTLIAILNYFLILYNQKYIVTETITRNKPGRKIKKNKTRLFDYKVLSVQLPKSGKKYRYDQRDTKSKGIMPFTEVPGTWHTYTEEAPMFGNPKLVGSFWIPSHVRGAKQAGFAGKDYCVKSK